MRKTFTVKAIQENGMVTVFGGGRNAKNEQDAVAHAKKFMERRELERTVRFEVMEMNGENKVVTIENKKEEKRQVIVEPNFKKVTQGELPSCFTW